MLEALQKSAFVQTIAQSQVIIASLSALHALGFAMVTSSALVFLLRTLGWLFVDRPRSEIARPAGRVLMLGACMNIVTGTLMFSTRATSALANEFFRAKMLLLASALLVYGTFMRRAGRPSGTAGPGAGASVTVGGILGAVLWLAVGVAGCAFILIE
jgi:hypothetical protein